MKNRQVSAIQSLFVVITTLVYAIVVSIFFELNNISGEEEINVNNVVNNDNKSSAAKLVDVSCKSPCPPNAEMCIEMCA